MSNPVETVAAAIEERLGARLTRSVIDRGQLTIECAPADLLDVCTTLRDDPALDFRQLVDLCGVDYLDYGRSDWQTSETATGTGFSRGVQGEVVPGAGQGVGEGAGRFAVVYHLLSHSQNVRVRLRCYAAGDPPIFESVCPVWSGANWYEREAFDLYGILFQGHDDLRRLLTDYGFVGHPFRKDFPLVGEVEMRYDPELGRVVYEPTRTEMRVLVPKVVRHDARYDSEDPPAEDDGGEAATGGT